MGVEADFAPIDARNPVRNIALALEPIDPAPARRGRKPNLLSDLRSGLTAVALQFDQDSPLEFVQILGQNNSPYAKIWNILT
jgi:hypothetical protein